MGIVQYQVTFEGKAPSLKCIVQKVTELSALQVQAEEWGQEIRGNLYQLAVRRTRGDGDSPA